MEARLHYSSSRPVLMLQPQGPAASPAPGAAVSPDARPPVLAGEPNSNAILILALLTCGLLAALALRVVLQCALHVVTRLACYGGADDDDAPEGAVARPGRGGNNNKQQPPPGRRMPALVRALPCLAFSAGLPLAGSSRSECAICLAEFARGEPVRVLPRCGHGFHARCIDRWLAARPTCPTCRQAPFAEPTALLQPPDLVLVDSSALPATLPLVRVVIVGDRVARLVEP
ncbi:hypothetical protein U9M48_044139 [Paspalum notatum var. saurae]|uniref:RING-type domain-containing protein n=1 Tax=Paspalum notatum var. saurae TaxID=547442 RepID=A0AAQ3XHX4_PASNO